MRIQDQDLVTLRLSVLFDLFSDIPDLILLVGSLQKCDQSNMIRASSLTPDEADQPNLLTVKRPYVEIH